MNLSVIICTHNPRRNYLDRVLWALQEQTLPLQQWELLLIDNASDSILTSEVDLTWHPNARHIREEQLGLTPARLRGIRESQAKIIVFVDDDNILNPDFLEKVLNIGKEYPHIGAWGGQVYPEFEVQPAEWTKPYWNLLAVREFNKDNWSNASWFNHALPCGAGLCVRKNVALKYKDLIQHDLQRLNFGRKGNSLSSCEDSDLALTACDLGLGTGTFTSLKLTHLLPEYRLQESYLLKLVEGIAYSGSLLRFIRTGEQPFQKSRVDKLAETYRLLRTPVRTRRFHYAREQGIKLALKEITNNICSNN